MITLIGLVTMGTLVWVIASSLARESDSEKRREILPVAPAVEAVGVRTRPAA